MRPDTRTMTLILKEHADGLEVLDADGDDAGWPKGALFAFMQVPRSLTEDQRLIETFSAPAMGGVCLTSVETPADIEKASTLLRVAEAMRGAGATGLAIVARLDTARAALGLADFNRATPRLVAFLFDAPALATDADVAEDSALVSDLQLRLPLAARACGAVAVLRISEPFSLAIADEAARNGYAGLCQAPVR
jgi:citrate lyase beta subunit